jgi:hypothetical protein
VLSMIVFTIAGGKIVEMDILADPERLSRLDLSAIEADFSLHENDTQL